MRKFFCLIHRWAGLATALFLILTGLTGSVLAFYPELQRWTNPNRYLERPLETWLQAGELAARLEANEPRLRVKAIDLQYYDDTVNAAIVPQIDPMTGQPFRLGYKRLALDPATGAVLVRIAGSFAEDGWHHLWSFMYYLHYALALGYTGKWILGITAMVWTLDCFVALYLTMPPHRRKENVATVRQASARNPSWRRRWAPAWHIRWRAGRHKLNFDLHRTGGLWFWPLLLIFAWSSVSMDMTDTVYTWVTRAVFDYRPPWTQMQALAKPLDQPRLSWTDAEAAGRRLMAEQARHYGFAIIREQALRYDAERGVYTYQVQSDREIDQRPHMFGTQLSFDGNTGALKYVLLPSGQYAGNTVSHWLYALHMANVFGLPYRIFVCLLGLVIVMLSVTGIIIWLKKRQAARQIRRQGFLL